MEVVAIKTKEELMKKEKRRAIILVSKGSIPKDFPKEKIMEYLSLKFEVSKGGDMKRMKELEEELKKWPRNPENDPAYFAIINLCEELRFVLGYETQFAFENYCSPSLEETLQEIIRKGYTSIIVVPLDFLTGLDENSLNIIEKIKNENFVEISIAWPYKIGHQADFIATHILSFIRRNM